MQLLMTRGGLRRQEFEMLHLSIMNLVLSSVMKRREAWLSSSPGMTPPKGDYELEACALISVARRQQAVPSAVLRPVSCSWVYGMQCSPQETEQRDARAIQEYVDLVGLSCLFGGHRYLFLCVVELLRGRGSGDIIAIGDGIIPDQDFQTLYHAGIRVLFALDASPESFVDRARQDVEPRS